MTKTFEEITRPDNGPITELNNNMQEVFSQYRKMRQYVDYLEYELKQKDEHILKVENENSFMRDERTTFDSNGNSVEPIIPQQALPVVPEYVGIWIKKCQELNWMITDVLAPESWSSDFAKDTEKWLKESKENFNLLALAFITGKYEVEKPQLFYLKNKLTTSYLILDTSTGYFEHWGSTEETGRYKSEFTQSEIDSMETGSYEQIEVAE